jgi:ketosteroid isomerase-like protein
MVLSAAAALYAAALSGPALGQQYGGAPEWARVLLAADMDPAAGKPNPTPAPTAGVAARLTIVPAEGGVARVIRYSSGTEAPGRMTLLRFTGHPRVGWSMWGADVATRLRTDAVGGAEIDRLLRAAARAGAVSGEPRQTGPTACTSGDYVYLEVSDGVTQTAYERRCSSEGAVALAARVLSRAAGSEDEESLHAAGVKELMDADRAFAARVQEVGISTGFVEFAHEDVVIFAPGREPYRGKSGVRERFARLPAGTKLTWAPVSAEIAARGDMGWTWGRGVFTLPDGTSTTSLYVSVWRRDFEGAWRYVMDMGVDGPPISAAPTPGQPKGADLRR